MDFLSVSPCKSIPPRSASLLKLALRPRSTQSWRRRGHESPMTEEEISSRGRKPVLVFARPAFRIMLVERGLDGLDQVALPNWFQQVAVCFGRCSASDRFRVGAASQVDGGN